MRRLKKHADAWLNSIGDGYVVDDITDLRYLCDEVGDEIEFDEGFQEANRDFAFMYYKGEIYTGATHHEIAKQVAKNEKEFDNFTRSRSGFSLIDDISFGHIYDGVAVIEEDVTSASISSVISALKSHGIDKVYVVPCMFECEVERVAKATI